MAKLVADCPRCGSRKMTFDLLGSIYRGKRGDWQKMFELMAACRHCKRGVIFVVSQQSASRASNEVLDALLSFKGVINDYADVERYVSIRDDFTAQAPEHVPEDIKRAFNEAATSVSTECWNAAGAMFRACLDLATRPLIPPEGEPNAKIRRDLGLRLPWLFDNHKLPGDLRRLSGCIREDGNDGAHQVTLGKAEAEDMQDFTATILQRLYTEPEKVRQAEERTKSRRS